MLKACLFSMDKDNHAYLFLGNQLDIGIVEKILINSCKKRAEV